MGYYENPPMVQSDRSASIIADSIIRSSESIAKGFIAMGERKRQEEKERKLTVQKLQDQKNKVDLFYNEKLSEWSKTQSASNPEINTKIQVLIQDKLRSAADSQIALLSETNQEKRQEYLSNIRNADQFLNNSAIFGKAMAETTATWRESAKALKVGVPGGFVINGKTDKEILDNTAAVEVLGGMGQMYEESRIDVAPDEEGSGVLLIVSGKHKNGEYFNVTINSKQYLASETAGDGGLLSKVESLDDFYSEAKKEISDKNGNIFSGYLSQTRETVDLPSKGSDIYQIRNGQRLQTEAIKSKIDEKSQFRASGIMATYKNSDLRTLIDYTLGNGPGYYDDKFKNITSPEQQKTLLAQMLTEKSFSQLTEKLEKTKDKEGNTVYWNPTADIGIKAKPEKQEQEDSKITYKVQDIDKLIIGNARSNTSKKDPKYQYEQRTNVVESLNVLSGSNKFMTRDELFKVWKNQPYVSAKGHETGRTIEEEYSEGKLKDKNIKNAFQAEYPSTNGYYYEQTSSGLYEPIPKSYNMNSAYDRVKLALDRGGLNATEVKQLQGKLKDAKLMDWITANERKEGETEQQYAARAKKALL